jgi:molecular chaperone DnaK
MSELAIGIDLGTSNSCVAVARNGKVEVLANQYGEMTTASVVAFHDDGMIEVGNHAKANIVHDPVNTICSAKRLIGRYYFSEEVKKAQAVCAYEIVEGPQHGVRAMARDEEFSLPEISAMVLREMKQIAEAQLGEPVTKAVITVPAYFNDNQRQATKDAGKIAGLEVLRILNEPTAAALAYGFGSELNQRVAVYDLGGGTFDVSVLEIGKGIFEVLSTCGDTFLGGDDFDDRLIDLLADEFVAKEGINLRLDPYAFEKIKVAAENAKKTLSREESVEIHIPDIIIDDDGETHSLKRSLSHEEYCALVQDLVMRTFKVCDEALQQADLTTRDLDGVILVGGPTRLPLIRQAVRDYFQQELKDDVDPDQVVAKGAAIHAASLCGGAVHTGEHDAFLLDVTPLDLRIGVAGGLAEPIIERNTPIPIEQTRRFSTTRDFQDSVQIRVFQGDSRQATGNEILGEFEFSGFKSARRGDVAIDVTFEINADGIVNVTAFDPDSGERASTSITLSSGLSGDEIESIIEDDKTSRVHAPEAIVAAAVGPAASPGIADIDEPRDETPEPLAAVPDLEPEALALEAEAPELAAAEPELEVDNVDLEAAEPELEVEAPAVTMEAPAAPAPPAPESQLEAESPAFDAGAENGVELELDIGDDELLELADGVEPELNSESASALAVTDVHILSAEEAEEEEEEAQCSDDALDDSAPQVEIESTAKEDLFDTSNVDLSSGIEDDH